MMAPRIAPPIAAPPIFRALSLAGETLPRGEIGFGAQRHFSAVRQHQRVEPHAEARGLLHLSASLHERDRPEHARAGRNRDPSGGLDVARDPRFHAILDPRPFARERSLDLQADDRRRREDDLFELRFRGSGRGLRRARRLGRARSRGSNRRAAATDRGRRVRRGRPGRRRRRSLTLADIWRRGPRRSGSATGSARAVLAERRGSARSGGRGRRGWRRSPGSRRRRAADPGLRVRRQPSLGFSDWLECGRRRPGATGAPPPAQAPCSDAQPRRRRRQRPLRSLRRAHPRNSGIHGLSPGDSERANAVPWVSARTPSDSTKSVGRRTSGFGRSPAGTVLVLRTGPPDLSQPGHINVYMDGRSAPVARLLRLTTGGVHAPASSLFVALLTLSPVRADALTVRDVLELTRAGLGDEVLLALIDVDRSVFPIDAATLKCLKDAGSASGSSWR